MIDLFDPKDIPRITTARESHSGRLLTDRQFDEAMSITGIVEHEIKKSGSFKDKLGDYAHAFARSEKFDAMKAETILRDLFKERCGQSMNEMRKSLMEREQNLSADERRIGAANASEVGNLIKNGNKISFNRAYAHQAQNLGQYLGITDKGAKSLMKEEFKIGHGEDFYEWGKEIEKKHYRPQIEAERQARDGQSQSVVSPEKGMQISRSM